MKSNLKRFLLALAASLMLVSCGNNPATSTSGESSQASSQASSGHPAGWVDYVSQCKLTESYTGKSFLTDGIGEVTLKQKIDGDTAHFAQKTGSSVTIKGRYNCIDTPESTGMIEPWGKGASNYNGELLYNAKHIVLSTDSHATAKPAVDSTGGRFLVYIWVANVDNPTLNDFINVNLSICSEGWSKAKGASGTDFGNLFISASSQAQKFKMHVWSSEKDPDFNYDDPVTIDLRMIVDGLDSNGEPFDWVDKKVTFVAIVAATGPDKGAAFVNKDFEVGGVTKRYGIYIFTSYQEYEPLKTIGNEVQITGIVGEYEGVKQVVDVSYSKYYPDEYDMKILSRGNQIDPIEGTAGQLAKDEYINVVVKTTLKCTGGYAKQNAATQTAYSFTLYCCNPNNSKEELNIFIVDSLYISDGEGGRVQTVDYFKNATSLTITGGLVTYTTTGGKLTYQVKLCKAEGLVVTK